MNALRNKVQLIGRLGKDPESFVFDDGKIKVRFPIATNESYGVLMERKRKRLSGMI